MADGRDRNRRALQAITGSGAQRRLSVAIYPIRNHHRSELTTGAMAEGIAASGDYVTVIPEATWKGKTDAEVAIIYGLEGNTPEIFDLYRRGGEDGTAKAVYLDLGYWGRREGGRWAGFHKVVVNDRHPNSYLMQTQMPADRLAKFHVEPKPLRTGGHHILLCGMGEKGAAAVGLGPEEWERQAIAEIRAVTDRPIVYRPKPSWKNARPIEGTRYSDRARTLEEELVSCHALVARHSNAAAEALLAGVPAYAEDGVAALMADWPLAKIHAPTFPPAEQLRAWAQNIAYTQWSIAEMRAGLPWRHLRQHGLV